jgi:GTP cyclohydrolase II
VRPAWPLFHYAAATGTLSATTNAPEGVLEREEQILKLSAPAMFVSHFGRFRIQAFEMNLATTHWALWMGPLDSEPLLTRVQSACTTGTAFAAMICDCGPQVHDALQRIGEAGRGLFVYLDEEARGHGIREKVNGMAEMNKGASTVTAYTSRGLPADKRTYADVSPIMKALGIAAPLHLMTNNPKKVAAIQNAGWNVAERVPIEIPPTPLTREYLIAKQREFGHIFHQELTEV